MVGLGLPIQLQTAAQESAQARAVLPMVFSSLSTWPWGSILKRSLACRRTAAVNLQPEAAAWHGMNNSLSVLAASIFFSYSFFLIPSLFYTDLNQ